MSSKPVTVIMPASGEASPTQLGVLLALREVGYKPDEIICSSGGAVGAMIGCAAGFEREFQEFQRRVYAISDSITTNLYLRRWRAGSMNLPFAISATVKPTLYNRGRNPGINGNPFNFNLEKQPNLIIGTKCIETGTEVIWYTRSFRGDDSAIIRPISDISKLMEVVRASASMPGIVPPITIDGYTYHDAGMDTVSPFAYLKSRYTAELNIILIAPFDIYNYAANPDTPANVLETVKEVMLYRKYSKQLEALRECLELLEGDGKIETNEGGSFQELIVAMSNIDNSRKHVLLLYPNHVSKVDLMDMGEGDYTHNIRKTFTDGIKFKQWMIFY